MKCRICGESGEFPVFRAREMMYGTREEFDYFQCGACGCIQLDEVPEDLGKFYADYGSLIPPRAVAGVRGWLKRHRDSRVFRRTGGLGWLAEKLHPYPTPGAERWLSRPGVTTSSRILDVGGGAGHLLLDLQGAGYRNLLAVDPFLAEDVHHPGGVSALRCSIHDLDGEFDVIMLHHVLEHVPDQRETLASVARLLSREGYCLIRTPLASSAAWERYREDWAQLDPPRHIVVHSQRSLAVLADACGLQVAAIEFDSTEFQFTASEGYQRNVPLIEQRPPSLAQRRRYRREADRLNGEGRGDQAAFYLRRAG